MLAFNAAGIRGYSKPAMQMKGFDMKASRVRRFVPERDLETFTLTEVETGETFHWSVTLAQHLVDRETAKAERLGRPSSRIWRSTIPITQERHDSYVAHRDIDEARIGSITLERAFQPVLAFADNDLDACVIDGHHRIVWLYRNGFPFAQAIIIPRPLLDRECRLEALPAE